MTWTQKVKSRGHEPLLFTFCRFKTYSSIYLTKSKKINRYLKVLENNMVLNKINLRFYYKDYLKNKESINKIINMGYSVSIVLDETFIDDYDSLILFSYVFIYEKYDYYDIIIDSKDTINTTIVTL